MYGNNVYGLDEKAKSKYTFRSEEDLLDETRENVAKHISDDNEYAGVPAAEKAAKEEKPSSSGGFFGLFKSEPKPEPKPASAEPESSPAGTGPAPEETNPVPAETQSAQTEAQPAVPETDRAAAETQPAGEPSGQQAESAPKEQEPEPQDQTPQAESYSQSQPETQDEPQQPEQAAVPAADPQQQTADASPDELRLNGDDIVPVKLVEDNEGNLQPVGQSLDFSRGKGVSMKPALEQPILKKMDVNRISASPYYETYEGLRLLKYFTVAQRVEIYEEPRPIDTYILDAHAMRYLYGIPGTFKNPYWNVDADYRQQLVPIFTRAYGTEFTISDPKNKEGQIRYTHDYRDIYKNWWPKYPDIKVERWDQNEVLLMHSKDIEPIGWLYTLNLGYRYSTMSCKSDPIQTYANYGYYKIRHTYFGSVSVAPTDKVEYFWQGEYFKSKHVKCMYAYNPDHYLSRGEIRIKSNDMKTVFVPQFSYSQDMYHPFDNYFEKYEIAYRVGRDWTKRFSSTHTIQYVLSLRRENDNQSPYSWVPGYYNPLNLDKAECIAFENRFSYNIYDRLYVQTGCDLNMGLNWSVFDNVAMLGGIEYYAPGMIRVDVGWRGNYYVNLSDFMSSVYFKFYIFM